MWGDWWAVRILSRLANGLAQVGGEIENELAMNDHVVVGFFEVAREHFWGSACRRTYNVTC